MNRLLVIACSERKKPAKKQLPAIERYDGPAFRVLRKFLHHQQRSATRIMILSGKYGLIDAATNIDDYDFRITPATARRLRPAVLKRLCSVLRTNPIRSVGICLGRDYLLAVDGLKDQLPEGATIDFIGGGLGQRLTKLRDWLNRHAEKGNEAGERIACAHHSVGPRGKGQQG